MIKSPQWIIGSSRSGKTAYLRTLWELWRKENPINDKTRPSALILTANEDNRRHLADQLAIADGRFSPVVCKTLLGFIIDEVWLFWPLLFEKLQINAQFPLRLRPETEQALATQLWRPDLEREGLSLNFNQESQFVRETLDLMQLAGANAIPCEDISFMLERGLPSLENSSETFYISLRQPLISKWQKWCLKRGLLSYGLIYELYWRYLLKDIKYQGYLQQRYQGLFADDVDDYGGIFRDLAELMLDQGTYGVFTYHLDGQIRVGLGANPGAVSMIADRCEIIELQQKQGLARDLEAIILPLITETPHLTSLPNSINSLQTTLRSELLRKVGNYIVACVEQNKIKPEEIAIIAPGLDEIARYTLIEILTSGGVAVEPLNEQRPLISCPLVRALLTLLALVYSGLGRWVLRDDVAEMLVILSQKKQYNSETPQKNLTPDIDPVRAGLIADHCYHVDPEKPKLLPIETFSRWDRIGYKATTSYQKLCRWIEETQQKIQQQPMVSPMLILHWAIRDLIPNTETLPYDHLASLRELMETVQHYGEIQRRIRFYDNSNPHISVTVGELIKLLRQGTITANPRPLRYFEKKQGAVTLATIFQYRSLRSSHRWHFWLDIASPLWEKGGSAILFGAPLFLQEWSGQEISPEDTLMADQARLERILKDLLGRVQENLILCHSDLNVKGTEQSGVLLNLVQGTVERMP